MIFWTCFLLIHGSWVLTYMSIGCSSHSADVLKLFFPVLEIEKNIYKKGKIRVIHYLF